MEQSKQASLTVEASLVLPIFFYAQIIFVYLCQFLLFQENLQQAMVQAAYELSHLVGIEQVIHMDETDDNKMEQIIGHGYLELAVRNYMKENEISSPLIIGWHLGINFLHSKILEEDQWIQVIASYYIRIPVPFFRLPVKRVQQRVDMKAFMGKRLSNEGEKQQPENNKVYITEHGRVYHITKDCTYLKLSIQEISLDTLSRTQNADGRAYQKCLRCCEEGLNQRRTVYVTRFGDYYHQSLSCSSLKRSIKEVVLDSISGYRPCSRCSGGNEHEHSVMD